MIFVDLFFLQSLKSRLGNLAKLIDQLLLAHLVQIARESVVAFVKDNLNCGTNDDRDAFMKCFLVFEFDKLTVSPNYDCLRSSLRNTVTNVAELLSKAAENIDGAIKVNVPETAGTEDVMLTEMSFTRRPSKRKKVIGESRQAISPPDLKFQSLPTKEEDDLGQKTPPLVKSAEISNDLVVNGVGFVGQYSPLSRGNLQHKLDNE